MHHTSYFVDIGSRSKKMGYKIKVDTNGTRPDRLRKLIALELIDYIVLDFKAPAEKHEDVTKSKTYCVFNESLQLIRQHQVPFEVRTTWHSYLLSMEDLHAMVDFLVSQAYSGRYYIQRFMNGVTTLDDTLPASIQRLDVSRLSRPDIQVV
ncbi:anaerobic ribonucleoside-triphosphate reductase activating protein [Sphingobacterium litopenaei]|uniref:Anaerobic ribonucleoside-triphosphate reductase activating protein n=1 Tax=Sphingobacterium litopenaei TaxID=2763500 RepID=A0ABR7YDA7_9SPHI|nr:anaerobic ribonucleoside-triphosphate reductase activating protein [Sphingobacterium litopenaei]MBD1429193.1 anaerobic ribonucleoside-triphosphate reductase activating protein [Sphingobacterium litopenaei]